MGHGSFRIVGLALVAFYFFAMLPTALQAQPVLDDKMLHFTVAATAQTSCMMLAKAIWKTEVAPQISCFLILNAAGAVKEMTDPGRGGDRDPNDIAANVAGSGLALFTFTLAF